MKLDELIEKGREVSETAGKGSAIFQIIITPEGEGFTTAINIGGDAGLLRDELAKLIEREDGARMLIEGAVELANNPCDCEACRLKAAIENDDEPTDAFKAFVDKIKGTKTSTKSALKDYDIN